MKVKEILDLSMSKTMAVIAKEHLTIGEKPLRSTLKEIGCEHESGKKGWRYAGDIPEILERSIYEFVQMTKGKAEAINHNASTTNSIEIASAIEVKANKSAVEASQKKSTSELDAIDMLLLQNDTNSN